MRLYAHRSTVQGQTIMGNCCTHVRNWMDTMMTDTYLMWKPNSFVNMIYKVFVSDGKTDHLRKVCNNIYFCRHSYADRKHILHNNIVSNLTRNFDILR